MRAKLLCVGVFLGGILSLTILHRVEFMVSDPLADAQARAEELGWTPDRVDVLGGGYGSKWLSHYAYVTLREKDAPRRVITVRLEKPLPLIDWRAHRVSVEGVQDS